jgi:hypothetical protein
MDGLGIRPVMWKMGQRFADGGYLVLQPDLYYRFGSYLAKVPSEILRNPKSMGDLMKWVNSLDRERKVSDSSAFIEFLFIEARRQRKAVRRYGLLDGRQRQLDRGGRVSRSIRSGRVVSRWKFGNRQTRQSAPLCEKYREVGVCRRGGRRREFFRRAENPPRKGFKRRRSEPCSGDLFGRTPRLCRSGFAEQ